MCLMHLKFLFYYVGDQSKQRWKINLICVFCFLCIFFRYLQEYTRIISYATEIGECHMFFIIASVCMQSSVITKILGQMVKVMDELFSVKLDQGLLQNIQSYLFLTYNSPIFWNYLFLLKDVLLVVSFLTNTYL